MTKEPLWKTLTDEGYIGDAESFRAAVIDEYNESVKDELGWSGDELVLHLDHAKEYCQRVRDRIKCGSVSYPTILRTLINIRRRGLGAVNVNN
jgi:hypothetical protein